MNRLNTHLVAVARNLVLNDDEKKHINTSIINLQGKLYGWFGDEMLTHFRFGSSTRDTILPRRVDNDSDIDYMVVFQNKDDYKPATLLNWLRRFVENKYSRSEIYPSYPTIVLELSRIKFELVPAIQPYWWNNAYHIPAPSSNYMDWLYTSPENLKKSIDDADKQYNYQIKRLVRLLKYWNVMNNKVYSSYEIEEYVSKTVFWGCSMLEDYFFYAVKWLPIGLLPQYKKDKVIRFQKKVEEIKDYYYRVGLKDYAVGELKMLLPMR